MYQYLEASLFDSPAQTLVNTVNTVGVMGKGIAAEFRRRYPDMFEKYREFCSAKQLTVGRLYLYRTENKWILNFPTKQHWRHPSKIEYIEAGLLKFVSTYSERGITSISFPQLGCGNGGLEWNVVRSMMEKYLGSLPINVYVHLLPNPRDFVPEHLSSDAIAADRKMRRDIGYNDLVKDLRDDHAVEVIESDAYQPSDDDERSRCLLVFPTTSGTKFQIFAVDLESFWNSLRLRGALSESEFPAALRKHSGDLIEMLCRLKYVRPVTFRSPTNGGLRGVRFAPPPSQGNTGIDVAQRNRPQP